MSVQNFGLLVLGLLAILVIYLINGWEKKKAEQEDGMLFQGSQKKKHNKLTGSNNWYRAYKVLSSFILTRSFVKKIEPQFAAQFPGDAATVREKTVKLAAKVFGLALTIVLVLIISTPDIYKLFHFSLVAILFSSFMISDSSNKIVIQLLKEYDYFLDKVRYRYMLCGVIDDAVEQSIEYVSPMMKLHAKCFLDILRADPIEIPLQDYCDTPVHMLLKRFLSLSIPTMKNGDTKKNGDSIFIKNIDHLQTDVKNELLKLEGLQESFKFLQPMCILPLLCTTYIAAWGPSIMTSLEVYYKGSYGVLMIFVCSAISIYSYMKVTSLKESFQFKMFDQSIFKQMSELPVISDIIDGYLDKNYGETNLIGAQLKRVGSSLTPKAFLMKRVVLSVLAAVAIFVIALAAHLVDRNQQLEDYLSVSTVMNGADEEQLFAMAVLTECYTKQYYKTNCVKLYNQDALATYGTGFTHAENYSDQRVIDYMKAVFRNKLINEGAQLTLPLMFDAAQEYYSVHSKTDLNIAALDGLEYKEAIKSNDEQVVEAMLYLNELMQKIAEPNYLETEKLQNVVIDETIERIQNYQNSYIHWYEVLIAILVAMFVYRTQFTSLVKNQDSLQMAMQDEVITYQSIIMGLMYFKSITVEEVLEWMQRFSVIFKDTMTFGVNYLPLGETQTLEKMIEMETFEMFQNLIQNVQQCDTVGFEQAFSNLEATQRGFQKKREQDNKFLIADKKAIAGGLSALTTYAVIILMLVVPFGLESFKQMTYYMNEMTSML